MTTWTRAAVRAATTAVLALTVGGLGGEPLTRPPLVRGQQLPRAGAAQPRNVIFVLVDDLRFDALGIMGHPWIETPNLDALARSGVQLRNTFVTTALCSPSRASILTGQYAHRHRVVDNNNPVPPGTTFFPQYLQKAGYDTAFIGKWHMGGDQRNSWHGVDFPYHSDLNIAEYYRRYAETLLAVDESGSRGATPCSASTTGSATFPYTRDARPARRAIQVHPLLRHLGYGRVVRSPCGSARDTKPGSRSRPSRYRGSPQRGALRHARGTGGLYIPLEPDRGASQNLRRRAGSKAAEFPPYFFAPVPGNIKQ